MKTTLFCYTGTGNSLWTARKLAGFLGETRLEPVSRHWPGSVSCESECIGLVFPVHIWGVPPPVVQFLERLTAHPDTYFFSIGVNAGQIAATMVQLQSLLDKKHFNLAAGFSLELPSNYIVWRGAIPHEKQQKKFVAAVKKIEKIAALVRNSEKLPVEKGPFWQNPFFSWIYRKSYPHIGKMDQSFLSDEKCTGCGICEKICPAQNIILSEGKPVWQHRCEQCFACIQWCPDEAIQYGKGTVRKKRYHHPDITVRDMLNMVSGRRD